jgi:pimeloyl-ACP methyl ester carboxylesterase
VLLSHGYSATTAMWRGQVEAFSGDYRIIAWDMRGHGQSDSPDDPAEYSEAKTVEDVAAILRECGEERAVIGGLSLGGYVSLAFHVAHPEMTRALMLFDTGPGYRNPQARAAWNETAEQRALNFEQRGLDALGGGSEVRIAQHRSAAGLAHAARGLLAQFDDRVINSLPEIAVPTLIVVGANDKPYLAGTDYMANKIPGARKVVIDDAGHSSNIDQPAAFNAAVRTFLTDLASVA